MCLCVCRETEWGKGRWKTWKKKKGKGDKAYVVKMLEFGESERGYKGKDLGAEEENNRGHIFS